MKHPFQAAIEELLGGGSKPEDWRVATLVRKDLDGDDIVKVHIPLDTQYFVDVESVRFQDHINQQTGRRHRNTQIVGAWNDKAEEVEFLPTALLKIGDDKFNRYRCTLDGVVFFDTRTAEEIEAARPLKAPGLIVKDDVVCESCYEIVRPLSESDGVMMLADAHERHVEVCNYCKLNVPCVLAADIRDKVHELTLADGRQAKKVIRDLVEYRIAPAQYDRKLRAKKDEMMNRLRMLRALFDPSPAFDPTAL